MIQIKYSCLFDRKQHFEEFRVLKLKSFLLFWLLNLFYEGVQFWFQKTKYWHSGKNIIETFNLISNIVIILQLFDATSFRANILNEIEEKQTPLGFIFVYTISPTSLLLRYITFALCLEKVEKFEKNVVKQPENYVVLFINERIKKSDNPFTNSSILLFLPSKHFSFKIDKARSSLLSISITLSIISFSLVKSK